MGALATAPIIAAAPIKSTLVASAVDAKAFAQKSKSVATQNIPISSATRIQPLSNMFFMSYLNRRFNMLTP